MMANLYISATRLKLLRNSAAALPNADKDTSSKHTDDQKGPLYFLGSEMIHRPNVTGMMRPGCILLPDKRRNTSIMRQTRPVFAATVPRGRVFALLSDSVL